MAGWCEPDLTTVDVPLGTSHVSQLTGKVYRSSDLGLVDVPVPYNPDWVSLLGVCDVHDR